MFISFYYIIYESESGNVQSETYSDDEPKAPTLSNSGVDASRSDT